jgi:hypothetical protein
MTDRERYDELVARMMKCQPGNDAFMSAWKELEQIKQSYGGYPPPEESETP